jgi:branched-chain amino acid aminotransferase
MSINFNGKVLSTHPEMLDHSWRGLCYGDGLFETIRMFNGHLPFMPLHWERLLTGLNTLGFEVPEHWSPEFFTREITATVNGNARIRITVYRSAGGFFAPTDNTPNFLITAVPLDSGVFKWQDTGLNVRQCERVKLPVDTLSGIKTLGATRYVAAALEARAKGADDVIVLNERGLVCEASSSNILWVKGDTVYAPLPSDGQVTGTFQKILSGVLRDNGVSVVEKPTTFAQLLEADEVMLTNAIQGIRWVQFLEGKELGCEKIIYFNKLVVSHLQHLLR